MWPSRGTAVGIVTELMNVHATLGIRVVAGDVVGDLGWARLGVLFKRHGPSDLGVSFQDGDCTMKE